MADGAIDAAGAALPEPEVIRFESRRIIPGRALFRTPDGSMLQISILAVEICFWREPRLRRSSPLKIDLDRLSCLLHGKQFSMDD
jgi:hypothetical protein